MLIETSREQENIITISARLPWEHVAMVDSLTMERLSTTRTDSLKILIEAGLSFKRQSANGLGRDCGLDFATVGYGRRDEKCWFLRVF